MRSVRTLLIGAGMVGVGILVVLAFLQGSPPAAQAQEPVVTFVDPQSLAGLSVFEISVQLEPLRETAKQALNDGDYETAAALFQHIAELFPTCPRQMNALLMAGIAQAKGGNDQQARELYDSVVSVGKALLVVDHTSQEPRPQMGSVASVRDRMRRAMKYHITLLRDGGMVEEALRLIQQFRAEEPEYYYLRKILPIEAELLGLDAEALKAKELQAARLSDQAKWFWVAGDADTAYRLADEVIADYPDTGAAMLARKLKGRMLWHHGRYDEAKALYTQIVDQLEPTAPTCDLVRTASCKLAWLKAGSLLKQQVLREMAREQTDADAFQQVRDACLTVMAWEKDPLTRVQAHKVMIEAFYREKDYQATLTGAEEFLVQHNRPKDLDKFKSEIAMTHLMAGDALLEMGRLNEALVHYRWLAETQAQSPTFPEHVQAGLHYRIWWALLKSRAPQDEVAQVADVLRSSYPGSPYIEVMSIIEEQEARRHAR